MDYTIVPDVPSANDAWISPDGKFYAVYVERDGIGLEGHWRLAARLGDETGGYELEKKGWVHLSGGNPMMTRHKPTQSQMDTLFDVWSAYQNEPEGGLYSKRAYFEKSFKALMENF
jgi:hypothetical protein